MADLKDWQLKELLQRCKLVVEDAEYAPDESWDGKTTYEFQDSCGCYSEWTTESCSFRIWIRGTYDNSDNETAWKTRSEIEDAVTAWVKGNLKWSGCRCCSGGDDDEEWESDGEDSISISVHLYLKKQEATCQNTGVGVEQ